MTFCIKRPLYLRACRLLSAQSAFMTNVMRATCQLVKRVTTTLALKRCVLCAAISSHDAICSQCRKVLPWNRVFCECCGQPLPVKQPQGVCCAQCQASPPPFLKARAPLIYSFPIDNVIRSLKFRHQLYYLPALRDVLLPTLRESFPDVDALLPVPLHRWRQTRRGYNQAYEISKALRKATGLRILTPVSRSKATRPQSGLTSAQRRENLRNAFAYPTALSCRAPLIVDDVITTGATVAQLASVLLKAGVDNVNVLAVARVDQFARQTGGGTLNV